MRLATMTAGAVVIASLALAGCSGPGSSVQWSTQSIWGAMPDLAFNLTDEQGEAITADAFHGDVTLLFLGYTHCPDICPATLALLNAARHELPPEQAKQVKILFVSVDPKRDSPKQLSSYTANFGDGVVGMTGSQKELSALTKRYRLAYRYDTPDKDGNYLVFHSSGIFAFDRTGNAALLMSLDNGLPAIAHDLKALVALPQS